MALTQEHSIELSDWLDPKQDPATLLQRCEQLTAQLAGQSGDDFKDLKNLTESVRAMAATHATLQKESQERGMEVTPRPGFVAKTTDEEGRKVFVNICGSPKVEEPSNWQKGKLPDHVAAALDAFEQNPPGDSGGGPVPDAEALRFPLAASAGRTDDDKAGQACTVYDVIYSADLLEVCAQHRKLKTFLVELALTTISDKAGCQLSREFKLPKLRYKGKEVLKQTIRKPKKELVQDLGSIPEEPTFALRSTKKKTKQEAASRRESKAAKAPQAAAVPAAAEQTPQEDAESTQGRSGTSHEPAQQTDPSTAPEPTPVHMAPQPSRTAAAASPASGTARAPSTADAAAAQQRQRDSGSLASSAAPEPRAPPDRQAAVDCSVAPQGSPVTGFTLTVTAPGISPALLQQATVEVEASREVVSIAVPGRAPCRVALPLAVGTSGEEGAEAVVRGGKLVLQLPYKPLTRCHQEALRQQQSFAALGSLGLQSQSAHVIED